MHALKLLFHPDFVRKEVIIPYRYSLLRLGDPGPPPPSRNLYRTYICVGTSPTTSGEMVTK